MTLQVVEKKAFDQGIPKLNPTYVVTLGLFYILPQHCSFMINLQMWKYAVIHLTFYCSHIFRREFYCSCIFEPCHNSDIVHPYYFAFLIFSSYYMKISIVPHSLFYAYIRRSVPPPCPMKYS